MPAILVCAACQTKLKVPETSAAKALRCPKCKGIVPVTAAPRPKAPPKEEEEFEVNEAADEQDEEFEVNEAVDEEDAGDDEYEPDEESALAKLGFAKAKDVFKKGNVPDDVRKSVEKMFIKNEKALWTGRPSVKIIESKAWIGLVVGPIAILIGLASCGGAGSVFLLPIDTVLMKVIFLGIGLLAGSVFTLVGGLAIIFRKGIGGNASACYVVTNKRAYIADGRAGGAVRAFTPQQLEKAQVEESAKFEGAGDLVFGYDFMGDQGVLADREDVDRYAGKAGSAGPSTPVGFLNIENVQLVKRMIHEVLVEPAMDRAEAKLKAKKKKAKEKRNYKPFG